MTTKTTTTSGAWPAVRAALEVLGGAGPVPDAWQRRALFHVLWGLWWAALFLAVVAFCGRSTKFVYIDF
jgi:hypothetical protein